MASSVMPWGLYQRRAAEGGCSSTPVRDSNPKSVFSTVMFNTESRVILARTNRPIVVRCRNGRCGKSSMFSMALVQWQFHSSQ